MFGGPTPSPNMTRRKGASMPDVYNFAAIAVLAFILLIVGGFILLILSYRRRLEAIAAPDGIVKAGRYLSGHPAMPTAMEAECFFHRGAAHFIAPVLTASSDELQIVGRLPVSAISAITVEDDALRRGSKSGLFRVHVAWSDAGVSSDALFEFGGKEASSNARRFCNALRNHRPVI
jgi:hypothetical protein